MEKGKSYHMAYDLRRAMECVAGYKIPGCSESCGEGCDWHIGPKKSEMTDG